MEAYPFLYVKLSILPKLLVILIVLSVTTSLKHVSTPSDSWFLLTTPVNVSSFHSEYSTHPFNYAGAYDGTKRSQSQVQSICWFGSAKICAVKIDYSKASPLSSLDDLDFTFDYTVDILGYEYKN
jgi:hypothetical protein